MHKMTISVSLSQQSITQKYVIELCNVYYL
jgi:hypothetical protein